MSSIASSTSPTTTSGMPRWFVPLLRIDAIGSPVIGVALVLAAEALRTPLGVGSALPVVLIGILFIVNGPVNGIAARQPTRSRLLAPIAIDSLFGVAMLAVAIVDPSGAELWTRWAIAGLAAVSFDLAVAKAWTRWRLAR